MTRLKKAACLLNYFSVFALLSWLLLGTPFLLQIQQVDFRATINDRIERLNSKLKKNFESEPRKQTLKNPTHPIA
jgi:hypothetical protein